jgi:hypothetical protein
MGGKSNYPILSHVGWPLTARIGILNKNNVQIARENYLAAQKALAESENLLAERAKREAEAKIKFNEIQLELAKLNNENMNMVSSMPTTYKGP